LDVNLQRSESAFSPDGQEEVCFETNLQLEIARGNLLRLIIKSGQTKTTTHSVSMVLRSDVTPARAQIERRDIVGSITIAHLYRLSSCSEGDELMA